MTERVWGMLGKWCIDNPPLFDEKGYSMLGQACLKMVYIVVARKMRDHILRRDVCLGTVYILPSVALSMFIRPMEQSYYSRFK